MPSLDLTKEALFVALDPAASAMLHRLAQMQGQKLHVFSATAMTLPAIFAAAEPFSVLVIKTDAETPEERFSLLLRTSAAFVRGYELDRVAGHA